ncbi:MAG: DegV family protein [Anaerolineaceae bacterium]|nr:DegV family protein [Anaerolineaceae bacterium]
MLRIVTDGGVDMPESWKSEFDIDVVPMHITFGNQSYVQGEEITLEEFYLKVDKEGIVPTTSQPSPNQLKAFYRKIAKKGDEILSIHLGSKLSGTYSVVNSVAKEMRDEIKIFPFDSGAGSAIQAFMCKEARNLYQAGISISGITKRLEFIREQAILIFTLDDLKFARLSGRINSIQSMLSSVLNIKPIIVLRDGLLMAGDKARTRKASISRVIDMTRAKLQGRKANVAIVHASDIDMAQKIRTKIEGLLQFNEIFIEELSIPTTAHMGRGAIGIVAYPAREDGN